MNIDRDKLLKRIDDMQELSDICYWASIHRGCHAFIEFNGLVNEFIKMCQQTLDAGMDFSHANVHGDQALVMTDYNARYLGEKFECIFGPTFRANPKLWRIFASQVLGSSKEAA